ncbi:MAG: hypothetical protein CMI02_13895 [Oceanospirillaceae bacterium]|nr:hypothetical protein [Oceanospirillaceae bacterium]MBT13115.1 hypothetical protein [Oceanospirillaceae bacterium]|tara:strand:+ start:27577 stop:28263 length:687 start_codon:yes stop_codon:yes gene_type:complete
MQFEYAETLKQDYLVSGEFYRLQAGQQGFLCRRRAEICHRDSGLQSRPDAVAVLMNPGSARPLSPLVEDRLPWLASAAGLRIDNRRLQALHPDNTQYQLMRLMRLMNWRHLRLINLSDLCDANSQSFAQLFTQLGALDSSHPDSLLHPARQPEMKRLLKADVRLAAWGSNAVLKEHAQQFLKSNRQLKGLALEAPWYRFASPYRKDQKLSWLSGMQQLLNSSGVAPTG